MNQIELIDQEIDKWWSKRRRKYNKGLILAGIGAFIAYCILGSLLIDDFEVTLFTTFLQGVGYLIIIFIANIIYNLGALTDKTFNSNNSEQFRQNLFKYGYWFSVLLPFLIPFLILIFSLDKS